MINNKQLLITSLAFLGFTTISGTLLASSFVSADNDTVVDEININVPVSCTLEATGQNTHNAEINNGQFNSSIGETTMKTFCNDNNGFAIYAIGYTNNEEGNNVLTNSTLDSTYDIVTGTATSGNTSNWAMKLSTVSDPTPTYPLTIENSFDSFHNVPDDYTLVAKRLSVTDTGTNAEGSTLKSTYQVYINQTQPAGTYAGQVKYTLIHPHDATVPIKPTNIESAMQSAGKQKYNGYYKMQDLVSSICDNVNVIETNGMTELIDVRDNTIYKVTKLKDDNCWMLDNLALDPTNPTTASNMSASNTNASAGAITNFLNGGSTTAGWSNVAVTDADSGFHSYTKPMINNASKDTLVTSYGPASTNSQAKVGVYYNYCAASVGTYCYDNDGVDLPDTLIDVPEDICPANWRMPTGGPSGEYGTLASNYGTTATDDNSLQYNLSLPLSGGFSDDLLDGQNLIGQWWSSTFERFDSMDILIVNPGMGIQIMSQRGLGVTIRCVLNH